MKILVVVAHGREGSLTTQAAAAFAAGARAQGHEVEMADLVAEHFDPVLLPADEPDWKDPDKVYSEEVRKEMDRIERNEATVMIFPIWWWSLPAILKGWIDRVWNHGWAYGARSYPHQRVLMLGIAGGAEATYESGGYAAAMKTQLLTGILEYCGVGQGDLQILFGSLEDEAAPASIIAAAGSLGAGFAAAD